MPSETFPGRAECAVGRVTDSGKYFVRLTLFDLPSEEYARKLAVLVERSFAEILGNIGGKLEGWEQ